jgi:putative copper resistance protein D
MNAALGIVMRWALVADLMLLFGMPLFALYTPAGLDRAVLRSTVIGTAALGLLLSIAGIVVVAANMSGVAPGDIDRATLTMLVTATAVGTAFIGRVVALVAALALGVQNRDSQTARMATAVCAAVALGSLAWSGHGVMNDGRTGSVHLVADIVHLLAAGVWVGALAALLWRLVDTGRNPAGITYRALAGFATVGSISVGLVVLTGAINSWLLIGPRNLPSLGTSLYGQLLLAKLALVAVMISLATINRFRLTPALGGALNQLAIDSTISRLRSSLAFETSAAVLVLGLVAWIGTLEPPVSMS